MRAGSSASEANSKARPPNRRAMALMRDKVEEITPNYTSTRVSQLTPKFSCKRSTEYAVTGPPQHVPSRRSTAVLRALDSCNASLACPGRGGGR